MLCRHPNYTVIAQSCPLFESEEPRNHCIARLKLYLSAKSPAPFHSVVNDKPHRVRVASSVLAACSSDSQSGFDSHDSVVEHEGTHLSYESSTGSHWGCRCQPLQRGGREASPSSIHLGEHHGSQAHGVAHRDPRKARWTRSVSAVGSSDAVMKHDNEL